MEYYPAIKKAKVCCCANMVEVEVIMLSEISLPQINSTHDSFMNSEIDESNSSGQSDAGKQPSRKGGIEGWRWLIGGCSCSFE